MRIESKLNSHLRRYGNCWIPQIFPCIPVFVLCYRKNFSSSEQFQEASQPITVMISIIQIAILCLSLLESSTMQRKLQGISRKHIEYSFLLYIGARKFPLHKYYGFTKIRKCIIFPTAGLHAATTKNRSHLRHMARPREDLDIVEKKIT